MPSQKKPTNKLKNKRLKKKRVISIVRTTSLVRKTHACSDRGYKIIKIYFNSFIELVLSDWSWTVLIRVDISRARWRFRKGRQNDQNATDTLVVANHIKMIKNYGSYISQLMTKLNYSSRTKSGNIPLLKQLPEGLEEFSCIAVAF